MGAAGRVEAGFAADLVAGLPVGFPEVGLPEVGLPELGFAVVAFAPLGFATTAFVVVGLLVVVLLGVLLFVTGFDGFLPCLTGVLVGILCRLKSDPSP